MARPHTLIGKSAKDFTRCTGCGRLLEKVNATRGPAGGTYGKECLGRAIRAYNAELEERAKIDRENATQEPDSVV